MASNYVLERESQSRYIRALTFAGDGVPLSGQIDYPRTCPDYSGTYPLIFVLHSAGSNTREDYAHYAHIGVNNGYAVFRWDKRGTGRSGAGGRGSTTQDAVNAYEVALEQPRVDSRRTIIIAQGEGSIMLAESFGLFARLQNPMGVILAGNMLDPNRILALETPLLIISGERDWMDWRAYGYQAAAIHNRSYAHGAQHYLAYGSDRSLMISRDNRRSFHQGAAHCITDWLTRR